MDAKLVVIGGKANMGEVKLRLPMTIGRGHKADLMISHPTVSREHCKLYEVDGALFIKDNGSSNGTFVNGERIEKETLVQPGQLLAIGPLTFRAEYDHPTPSKRSKKPAADAGLADTQSIDKNDIDIDFFLEDESTTSSPATKQEKQKDSAEAPSSAKVSPKDKSAQKQSKAPAATDKKKAEAPAAKSKQADAPPEPSKSKSAAADKAAKKDTDEFDLDFLLEDEAKTPASRDTAAMDVDDLDLNAAPDGDEAPKVEPTVDFVEEKPAEKAKTPEKPRPSPKAKDQPNFDFLRDAPAAATEDAPSFDDLAKSSTVDRATDDFIEPKSETAPAPSPKPAPSDDDLDLSDLFGDEPAAGAAPPAAEDSAPTVAPAAAATVTEDDGEKMLPEEVEDDAFDFLAKESAADGVEEIDFGFLDQSAKPQPPELTEPAAVDPVAQEPEAEAPFDFDELIAGEVGESEPKKKPDRAEPAAELAAPPSAIEPEAAKVADETNDGDFNFLDEERPAAESVAAPTVDSQSPAEQAFVESSEVEQPFVEETNAPMDESAATVVAPPVKNPASKDDAAFNFLNKPAKEASAEIEPSFDFLDDNAAASGVAPAFDILPTGPEETPESAAEGAVAGTVSEPTLDFAGLGEANAATAAESFVDNAAEVNEPSTGFGALPDAAAGEPQFAVDSKKPTAAKSVDTKGAAKKPVEKGPSIFDKIKRLFAGSKSKGKGKETKKSGKKSPTTGGPVLGADAANKLPKFSSPKIDDDAPIPLFGDDSPVESPPGAATVDAADAIEGDTVVWKSPDAPVPLVGEGSTAESATEVPAAPPKNLVAADTIMPSNLELGSSSEGKSIDEISLGEAGAATAQDDLSLESPFDDAAAPQAVASAAEPAQPAAEHAPEADPFAATADDFSVAAESEASSLAATTEPASFFDESIAETKSPAVENDVLGSPSDSEEESATDLDLPFVEESLSDGSPPSSESASEIPGDVPDSASQSEMPVSLSADELDSPSDVSQSETAAAESAASIPARPAKPAAPRRAPLVDVDPRLASSYRNFARITVRPPRVEVANLEPETPAGRSFEVKSRKVMERTPPRVEQERELKIEEDSQLDSQSTNAVTESPELDLLAESPAGQTETPVAPEPNFDSSSEAPEEATTLWTPDVSSETPTSPPNDAPNFEAEIPTEAADASLDELNFASEDDIPAASDEAPLDFGFLETPDSQDAASESPAVESAEWSLAAEASSDTPFPDNAMPDDPSKLDDEAADPFDFLETSDDAAAGMANGASVETDDDDSLASLEPPEPKAESNDTAAAKPKAKDKADGDEKLADFFRELGMN